MNELSPVALAKLVQLRQTLHKNPEVSGYEAETAETIVAFLKNYPPDRLIESLGGHGVAAVYNGKNDGPTVMLRCELDALPIEEINTFEHRSTRLNVSHKCGHDGHMTMISGMAQLLSESRPERGRVVLLYQPAEENGMGARQILEDPKFQDIEPDYVLALHNLPGYPTGQVVCRPLSFTAAVNSIIIKLHGRTSHAGEPDKGVNPALAISEIIRDALALQRPKESEDFAVVTPVQIELGEEAYGISAGYGELKFTIRSWTNTALDRLSRSMTDMVENTALKAWPETRDRMDPVFCFESKRCFCGRGD
jgi:amidohydrolase